MNVIANFTALPFIWAENIYEWCSALKTQPCISNVKGFPCPKLILETLNYNATKNWYKISFKNILMTVYTQHFWRQASNESLMAVIVQLDNAQTIMNALWTIRLNEINAQSGLKLQF